MPRAAYLPGESIPGTVYQVIRELGSGGMGRVYEVQDLTLGKQYALKTLVDSQGNLEEMAERLRREARTLAALAHPNIVKVVTAGVSKDGNCFYVMERLEGEPLSAILARKGALEPGVVVSVGIDISQALHVAHASGIVHRDLKPDNVFIALGTHLSTSAKLLDFGVAGSRDGGHEIGTIYGTLNYASPEQLRGEPPTAFMDIWSLGCVLYEAMAGCLPFRAKTALRLVDLVLGPAPAPSLSDFLPAAPRELTKLLGWMLDKDPSRRLAHADVVTAELRRIRTRLATSRKSDDNKTEEMLLGAMALAEDPVGPERDLKRGDSRRLDTQTAPPQVLVAPAAVVALRAETSPYAVMRSPLLGPLPLAGRRLRLPYALLLLSLAFGLVVGVLVVRRVAVKHHQALAPIEPRQSIGPP